jgi:hypothetical protein
MKNVNTWTKTSFLFVFLGHWCVHHYIPCDLSAKVAHLSVCRSILKEKLDISTSPLLLHTHTNCQPWRVGHWVMSSLSTILDWDYFFDSDWFDASISWGIWDIILMFLVAHNQLVRSNIVPPHLRSTERSSSLMVSVWTRWTTDVDTKVCWGQWSDLAYLSPYVLSMCHSLRSLALTDRVRHFLCVWVPWYQSQHSFDVSLYLAGAHPLAARPVLRNTTCTDELCAWVPWYESQHCFDVSLYLAGVHPL